MLLPMFFALLSSIRFSIKLVGCRAFHLLKDAYTSLLSRLEVQKQSRANLRLGSIMGANYGSHICF